ncbi:MAG: RHS repeat protein, partial [Verrucomicrobiae bacterium]|nr:RHS repeat protein [Verrucomicrobiae bacterium]
RLVKTTNAEGYARKLYYDGEGNLIRAIDARNNETQYHFDSLNRLRRLIDAMGNETVYDYDNAGNRTKLTDPRANDPDAEGTFETIWAYDIGGRLKSTTDAEGNTTLILDYDENDNITRLRNPRGFETQWLYDDSNRLVKITDAKGQVTGFLYDQVGNVTQITTPQGASYRTERFYDKLNREVETIVAPDTVDRASTKMEYHSLGMLAATVDALGHRTEYEYDSLRYLSQITEAVGTNVEAVWLYENDMVGNRVRELDPRGDFYETTHVYDMANRLRETHYQTGTPGDPGPEVTIYLEYDENDNLIKQSDPRSQNIVTQHFYDPLNRLEKTIDAEGNTWLFDFDAAGNPSKITNPLNHETTTIFNGNNQVSKVTDAEGGVTEYFYDPNGNVDYIIDGEGGETHFEYDELDRQEKRTDAEDYEWLTTYDAGNNIKTETDPRKFVTTYDYDFQNRAKKVTYDIGETPGERLVSYRYVYDAVGNLLEEYDPRGDNYKTTHTYDAQNRLERTEFQIVQPDGSISGTQVRTYEYDLIGNQTVETDGRGVKRVNEYDAQNRVVKVTRDIGDLGSGETAEWLYEYDLAGNQVKEIDPRGDYFTTEYTYDKLNRIRTITRPRGSPEFPQDPAVEMHYYNEAGYRYRVTGPREDGEGGLLEWFYEFDKLGRVHVSTDPAGNSSVFDYDFNGNLRFETHNSVDDGVPTRRVERVYDKLNRLRRVVDPQGFTTLYDYDEVGNAIRTIGPMADAQGLLFTTTQRFTGANLVYEREDAEDNVWKAQYDEVGNLIELTDGRGD